MPNMAAQKTQIYGILFDASKYDKNDLRHSSVETFQI